MLPKSPRFGAILYFAAVAVLWVPSESSNCTCQNPEWCKPITTPMAEFEIFTFITSNENWKFYHWDKITTIATFAAPDPAMICFAHSKGIRVVYGADFPGNNLTSATSRHKWVQAQVEKILMNHFDGINVDFEENIQKTDLARRDGLSFLMWELRGALKAINPHYQITFDTPYYPEKSSGRVFDYLEMSEAVDFYTVMAYDMLDGSDPANCPIYKVERGVSQFLSSGIPLSKLVILFPWYGYNYECSKLVGNHCIRKGQNQVTYKDIIEIHLPHAIGGLKFNKTSYSAFFNYKDERTGGMCQIWYDDPHSLSFKYLFATNKKTRGVGMWTADTLDYSNSTTAKNITDTMWNTLPKLKDWK